MRINREFRGVMISEDRVSGDKVFLNILEGHDSYLDGSTIRGYEIGLMKDLQLIIDHCIMSNEGQDPWIIFNMGKSDQETFLRTIS